MSHCGIDVEKMDTTYASATSPHNIHWVKVHRLPSARASGATADLHMRGPVRLFFEWDPLVALVNALAGHAIYRGLLWSFIILIPTLFFGRFFCGWICPMGTLQHWVGSWPSESKRGKQRIDSNRYKRWQTVKYVVLLAGLVAAVFGSAVIGWLDPFSLLVRSFGLSLLPAFSIGARAVLTPLEHSHVGFIRFTGESLHTVLQAMLLDLRNRTMRRACSSALSSSESFLPACV
jgi:hypothetical protein